MNYDTVRAFRVALEQRLLNRSNETGIALDRLRRRVLFERVVARFEAAEPGRWVVKGGMALEVRLQDDARLTKDLDLGLRDDVESYRDLHDRVVDALAVDLDGDGFQLTARRPAPLGSDGSGSVTWRIRVSASLAGKPFGTLYLDVSPRAHELDQTDRVSLPNLLGFAGVPAPVVEIVDVQRHAAEKFHAMLRDYRGRENSRVRDLIDVVLLIEHVEIEPSRLAAAISLVWAERNGTDPPAALPSLPESWPPRYERLAAEHNLANASFVDAVVLLEALWAQMFGEVVRRK